jgi:hypothetical protein
LSKPKLTKSCRADNEEEEEEEEEDDENDLFYVRVCFVPRSKHCPLQF